MPSRLPQYKISDYQSEDVADGLQRQYIGQGQDGVLIGDSFLATNRGRVKALTMTGTTDTTLELYVNDQPQFVSGQPNVVDQTFDNPRWYTYNRGDVIKVLRVAGLGTGGNVALDLEDHEVIKRDELVATPARERFTREAQRTSYLPNGDVRHVLQETWGSLAQATSRVQKRDVSRVNADNSPTTHRTLPPFYRYTNPKSGGGSGYHPGGPNHPGGKPNSGNTKPGLGH